MPYPEEMIAPMRAEVTALGATEVRTAEDVQAAMAESSGTALFFLNSVCGCAAGCARPGLTLSMQGEVKPDRLFTAFAGNDVGAAAEIRRHMVGYPPSSPSMALFKDGELVAVVERHEIQGHTPESLAEYLKSLYRDRYTNAPGKPG